jgi:hypothetical protein
MFFSVDFERLRAAWPPAAAQGHYREWQARFLRGERGWSIEAYSVLGLVGELGTSLSAPALDWSYNPEPSQRLEKLLKRHGVELEFDFDPKQDAPMELPEHADWPNLQFVSAECVRVAAEKLAASFKRAYPALEAIEKQLRAERLGDEADDRLRVIGEVLRWLPELEPDTFFAGIEDPGADWHKDLLRRAAEQINEEHRRSEMEGSDYEPMYFDWRSRESAEALLRVLEAAAKERRGLVIGQH